MITDASASQAAYATCSSDRVLASQSPHLTSIILSISMLRYSKLMAAKLFRLGKWRFSAKDLKSRVPLTLHP